MKSQGVASIERYTVETRARVVTSLLLLLPLVTENGAFFMDVDS